MFSRLANKFGLQWCITTAVFGLMIVSTYVAIKVYTELSNQASVQNLASSSPNSTSAGIALEKPIVSTDTTTQLGFSVSPKIKRDYPPTIYYNSIEIPVLIPSKEIQNISDQIVKEVKRDGFPINSLSISLIDLNAQKCCKYASYLDRQPRFPASVSKLFWMVALYAQINQKFLRDDLISKKDIYKMIQKSDNESASLILDQITGTKPGTDLKDEFLDIWIAKRKWVNRFFESAGYENINISQKNFPIPSLQMQQPEGRDLQIRGNQVQPIRNYLTTFDTARLLLEIHLGKAITPSESKKMEALLKRDLRPEAWKNEQYNSIEGFLGESLPIDTYFVSKVGWTSNSRQEVALIKSPDGSAYYILAIFGDHRAYAEDWEVFPRISRLVYEEMLAIDRESGQELLSRE